MACYEIDGLRPVVHPTAYVHPEAVLIGDVVVGPNVYIAPLASLRGDFGPIRIDQGANVQEGCVLHSFPEQTLRVEVDGHIGHGAILHGCLIGEDSLVGMNTVVMDKSVIGKRSIVAAQSFVKANETFSDDQLIMGTPAVAVRSIEPEELRWKQMGTREYHRLTERCHKNLRAVLPLSEVEQDRPALRFDSDVRPKS